MRLMRYDAANKQWVQLFSDSALDRYEEPYIKDIDKWIKLLKLDQRYPTLDSLKGGVPAGIINPSAIKQNPNARFTTDSEKTFWNGKMDHPVYNKGVNDLTDGQFSYNTSNGILTMRINNAIREIEYTKTRSGSSNFVGYAGNRRVIAHGLKNDAGVAIPPDHVSITPTSNANGTLGEYYATWDATNIYVYNTGSWTGPFSWMAHKKLSS